MGETVRLDVEDDIATVTLDRPEVRNALSAAMASELADVFESIEDTDARAVALRGAGEAFCAGGDVGAMAEAQSREVGPDERIEMVRRSVNRAVGAVADCSLPVVACVDGPVYGAGVGLLLACDCQCASVDATVSVGFRRVGLAIDSGVSHLLPRYVGPNVAKELVFTGERLDADRARSLGLFTRLFDDGEFEAGVANLLETIAEGPTVALSLSKDLLDMEHDSLADALEREATTQALAMETADHEEGATAFLERREPDFSGR